MAPPVTLSILAEITGRSPRRVQTSDGPPGNRHRDDERGHTKPVKERPPSHRGNRRVVIPCGQLDSNRPASEGCSIGGSIVRGSATGSCSSKMLSPSW